MSLAESARARLIQWIETGPGALLALLSGAVTTLAFEPFNFWPLAIVGPAILFLLWLKNRRWSGFQLGLIYGLGLMGSGVSWLHISIAQFGNLGWFPPLLITALFVLITALYYGLAGWLANRFESTASLRLLAIYPAIWVASEWFRGWFLSGFPWLQLGHSQIDSPLAGYSPLLGALGSSWAAALSAGLLLALVLSAEKYRTVLAALLLWCVGWGLQQVSWTQPHGDPLRVAMIQGNIPQEKKWQPDQLLDTLRLYATETRIHLDNDLIIWPETAIPAFLSQVDEPFVQPLESALENNDAHLVFGVVRMDEERQTYFNTMVSAGGLRDYYYKHHLVPFTEFLPFKSILNPLVNFLTIPMSDFAAGTSAKPLMTVGNHQVGMSICYEDAFGNEMIQALPEAAYLINASNDAWFGDSLAPHQHLQIARMRALETGRYLLRSTNTGVSAIIDPHGGLVKVSPLLKKDVLLGEIQPMSGSTPYASLGNLPILTLLLMSLMLAYPCAHVRDKRSSS